VADPLTILIAARDEEASIRRTVRALRRSFPDAEVLVGDDGSRDHTATVAEEAGATVLRLPRLGKGQALSAAERAAPLGAVLLCDADLVGELERLAARRSDGIVIGAFETRVGGGFGVAKAVARWIVRTRTGLSQREPLSGQRLLSPRARAVVFPLAPGFGCEVRMTIDAARAGMPVEEIVLPLGHRPTRRDLHGFLHRGRQLVDVLLAAGPLAVNFRGRRLPIIGWLFAVHEPVAAALGLADDLWSGSERGFRSHLRARVTTGTLKLVAIPAYGFVRTRSLSGALLVGLLANVVNQLDTRPGRALKAYLAAALALDAPLALAVLLLPYDLREMVMLGDAGSNALGTLLGLKSVNRFTGRGRWAAIGALAGLTFVGERTSLGGLIERTPGIRKLDALGRKR
jgi:Glycosyl transferase family 2